MIISFYSYKGGVGRSQLCANVAAYLCFIKDKKVLLWDFDFEAPGLHYFFGKTNNDIKTGGTIEMLHEYTKMMRTQTNVSENDYKYLPSNAFINLTANNEPNNSSKIDLIPAGNYSDKFVVNVNTFDWFEFYELLDGKVYIEELKKWIKSLGYDFILIDSRTGVHDYLGICNLQLPDTNVVVMAANDQSIDGCKRIMDQIINSEYTQRGFRKSFIFPILSRINTNHPNYNFWADKFTDTFHDLIPALDSSLNKLFTREVFKDFYLDKTLLQDEPQFSAGENILIKDKNQAIPRNSFMSKFANLGEYILKISEEGNIGLSKQIDNETWLKYADEARNTGQNIKAAIAYLKANRINDSIEFGIIYDAYVLKGNEFILSGNYDRAIEFYEKALPSNISIDILLEEYKRIQLKLDKNNGSNLSDIRLKSEIEINESKRDKARLELIEKEIIDIFSIERNSEVKFSDISETYLSLGSAYFSNGDYEQALKCYQRSVDFKFNFYEALFSMGRVYLELSNLSLAIKYFKRAIEYEPNDPEAYFSLGFTYGEVSNFEESIDSYNNALKIRPDHFNSLFNLGVTYAELGDFDKAKEFYLLALEVNSDDLDIYNNLGSIYVSLKQYDNAIQLYQRTIELRPDNYDGYNNLGVLYVELGNYDMALVCYQKAIELKSDFHEAYNNMGILYSQNENYVKAKECYEKAIELKPDFHDAYTNLGFAHIECGNINEAELVLLKGVSLGSLDTCNMNLGHVYLAKGKIKEAKEYYLKSILAYSDKNLFWTEMNEDFKYLKQYDITLEKYQNVLNDLKLYLKIR